MDAVTSVRRNARQVQRVLTARSVRRTEFVPRVVATELCSRSTVSSVTMETRSLAINAHRRVRSSARRDPRVRMARSAWRAARAQILVEIRFLSRSTVSSATMEIC